MKINKKYLLIVLVLIVVTSSCAPGNYRWNPKMEGSKPANFWAGLWHGLIVIITFIVSLFTKEVGIYEVNNVGWPYNLGYILGLIISLGGGIRYTRTRKAKHINWNEIQEKIRDSIKSGIAETEDENKKKEWEEIGKKIEEKLRRKLKEWAEKD
ncbi:MAG: hypothetical protein N2748_00275 [candidate division WOR-3 bacterium]|nr:hypothetical protein [candidate division WOR-3 bacterium]